MLREEMEESYETFEEELWPPRADPPPQKPVRQIRKPEMYATRKIREEMAPAPPQPAPEPKTITREVSFPKPTSLHKTLSIQNPTQIETPWENVTLNRCLLVAITILVLTSGFQRLNETLRGHKAVEEEETGLTMRRSGSLRHRRPLPEPETSLWEVVFWWLPDFDDEEEEDDDDDGEVKRGKSKRGATARGLRALRNKPLPDKKLIKQRDKNLKGRRATKARNEEIKVKKGRDKKGDPEDAGDEEAVAQENKRSEAKKKSPEE
ncbi:uncharacterized protein LOC102304341 isoform X1 [Haplochromis burtoni]|uniref:uncharacterized protein LOC102304341 isoform X1 n=2 Tax=Haplochromis burtoni TaxID=8153 RepID=UPI0003BC9C72|nr:uncharacterized protein LOC102304341 isoform X1 [Haplochromis burtoni]